jgi:hypothetical protein
MRQTKNAQPRVRLSARNTDLLASAIGSENTLTHLQVQRLCRRFGLPPTIAGVVAELACRGGGKSWAIAVLILRHVETCGPRARALYVRKSFPGLVDFEQVCREVFTLVYGRSASYNAGSHIWRFPNGSTLQLDQLEGPADFSKYQGKSYTLVCVDEAGQFSDPAPIDLLRSCLRAPAPIRPRFVLAANPGGVGHHWLARRHVFAAPPWVPYVEAATRRQFVNAPSTYVDNSHLDQPEYARQLNAATATDPELGRAWREGAWDVLRGAYFSSVLDQSRIMVEPWNPASLPRKPAPEDPNIPGAWMRRMVELQSGGPAPSWDLFLAHDFGVSAPSVTYVVGESPGVEGPDGRYYPKGSVVLLDEFASNEPNSLERGMGYTTPILAERIKDLAKRWQMRPEGVADDAIFSRTGSSAGTIADEFRRQGVFFRPARKGSRVAGWETMRRLLQDAGKPDVPGLYVSRLAEYFWATVPILPRDPRKTDDVDSRAPDHGADACRYALNRTPKPTTSVIYGIPGSY